MMVLLVLMVLMVLMVLVVSMFSMFSMVLVPFVGVVWSNKAVNETDTEYLCRSMPYIAAAIGISYTQHYS